MLFVESICDDEEVILANIREVKLSSPDYANTDAETAVQDFRQRIRHYEEVYESIEDEGGPECQSSFVKLVNVGARVIINRIQDYRQSRIVFFLMNLHIKPRSIFISRVSVRPLSHHSACSCMVCPFALVWRVQSSTGRQWQI